MSNTTSCEFYTFYGCVNIESKTEILDEKFEFAKLFAIQQKKPVI